MNRRRHPGPSPQRGAAALITVLLLFFIISLVAAYAGRNLIFEQRTSTNQYRATQAFEAAEAGLEWALAMLNGGHITADCIPPVPVDVAQRSFRRRYVDIDDSGNVTPVRWADGLTAERPSCVRNGANWNCSCPAGVAPTPAIPAGGAVNPAFRICFEAVDPPQPGVVRVVSTGRTRFVDQPCNERGEGSAGEAAATVSMIVALSSGLATPPSAALTAVGNVETPGGTINLGMVGALNDALMVSFGGPGAPLNAMPLSLQGTPIERLIRGDDSSLTGLLPDQLFAALFRMGKSTYKHQPAAVKVDCAVDCSAATLEKKVQDNRGRIIWVEGNATINSGVTLGSAAPDPGPALIVVNGSLTVSAAANIFGLVYSHADISLSGNPTVRGAIVAAGNFNIPGAPVLQYDPDLLRQLKLRSGSFVRVPGSWRDFP